MVAGYWSPCAPLVWNQGFPTPLGGLSMSTNTVKAPDIRFSSSQFRKQQKCHEKAVSRTCLAEAIYAWPYESISRGTADSPHSRPYQGIWGNDTEQLLEACQHVVAFVTHINRETHQHLDGQNLKTFLHEFGMKLNRTLVDHFYNFTFSDTGFQVRACLVMQFDDLRNVCPIHFHRLFIIPSSAGSWNATLALSILASASASEPPCSSMMLTRCRGLHNPVDHQNKEEGRE
ncbi:unnamed protein product [Schistosoma curassoni]|uniref:Centromere protein L n=1 Tax=Schistosoma curassoni TaxID=6186 RepID=A0A183KLD8_9TREM|nr:unnamed protein product [Schistosoma curassoni]